MNGELTVRNKDDGALFQIALEQENA